MKHIFLNLKRFDVPPEFGGVNRLASIDEWAGAIVRGVSAGLAKYDEKTVDFAAFFPEMHVLQAKKAMDPAPAAGKARLILGCQGVYRDDTAPGGNFGAFTTNKPASALKAAGCEAVIIGHCEERVSLKGVLAEGGLSGADVAASLRSSAGAVNRILNKEIKAARARGLRVLYCIGETADEVNDWDKVLGAQLETGLEGVDLADVCIAYEPVWSIGPGKTPAGKDYITKVARFVKSKYPALDVVYGGGLKKDNAKMLSEIDEISGGLIALTRFQGEIGFYPEEYLEIIREYLGH